MSKKISMHHSNSLFYECLAKIIMDEFMNCEFEISDRPDLQYKNKIGIEVTTAFPKGYSQAISLMIEGKVIDGNLSDQGYINSKEMPGLLLHPTRNASDPNSFSYIIERFNNKILKAKTYTYFENLYLFIFTDNLDIDRRVLNKIILKILEINKLTYKYIYLQYLEKLLIIDCINEKYMQITIDDFKRKQLKALELENHM